MNELAGQLTRGVLAGVAGTALMTPVQLVGMRVLPRSERDRWMPKQVFTNLAGKVGLRRHLDRDQEDALAVAAHFGYGATFGALYALWRRGRGSLPTGILFGLAIWAISYAGYLPASGLTRPPDQHDAYSMTRLAVAHVVYGAALGLLTGHARR